MTALVAIAAAAIAVTVGHSTSVRSAAKSTTFVDTTREDPLGPDIETVVVSNDDRGTLTFRVEIPSHLEITEDLRIKVWLDADADVETGVQAGGVRGADKFLLVDRWEYGLGEVALFTCAGSTCSGGKALPTGPRTPLHFSYTDSATFTVEAAAVGIEGPQRIRFWVEAWSGIAFDPITRLYDLTSARPDFAPDGAGRRLGYPAAQGDDAWIYDSGAMFAESFSTQPASPRAGKPFSLRLSVIRTDTGAPLTSGAVSCSARIAGRPLRAQSSGFVGGRAVCAYAIPANANRRVFSSTISVRFAGETLSRSISGRVS